MKDLLVPGFLLVIAASTTFFFAIPHQVAMQYFQTLKMAAPEGTPAEAGIRELLPALARRRAEETITLKPREYELEDNANLSVTPRFIVLRYGRKSPFSWDAGRAPGARPVFTSDVVFDRPEDGPSYLQRHAKELARYDWDILVNTGLESNYHLTVSFEHGVVHFTDGRR